MAEKQGKGGRDDNTVYEITMLHSDDPQINKTLEIAQSYLTDSKGAKMALNGDHFSRLSDFVFSKAKESVFNTNQLAVLTAGGFDMLQSSIQASTFAIQQEVRAVGSLVAACHEDTIQKLNTLQEGIEKINENTIALGENLSQAIAVLAKLQSDFNNYVEKDMLQNNIHRADSAIIRLNQELESKYAHNKELRRTAVGILQANDLNVRAETILTKAEELCIQTPNYWLAPALVVIAQWIEASRNMAQGKGTDDREVQASLASIVQMLGEAYRRECMKTALFFGLICRRANNISEANRWFMEYMSFQDPREVDHTCIVLLNAYAGGLMGHGEEEKQILNMMSDWLDELIYDDDSDFEEQLIQDWKNTCYELYMTAEAADTKYQALPAFCPETWPAMKEVMQASTIHRELLAFLEHELAMRDFEEKDLALLDSMIADLVTDFDADELPIRRELEYQQLVIKLEGNIELAQALRSIKDDILSETKSFVSILSDAARSSELSSATAATHVYAIRTLMPWIKKAYLEVVDGYRPKVPEVIKIKIDDFSATTTDGNNEEEVISQFVEFVNNEERKKLEASKTGMAQKVCLIGGAALAVISIILGLTSNAMFFLLAIIGMGMCGYGLFAASSAKKKQSAIQESMSAKRKNGVLVIRQVMKEVREWRKQFALNEEIMDTTVAEIDLMSQKELSLAS